MARLNGSPVRQFRGTTAQHANYTGPSGELTVDTSKNAVVVQDGVTKGGHPAAVDATVVHNTGDETVAGLKTFTNRMLMKMRGPWLYAKDTVFERGTVPAAGTGGSYGIGFYDKHADHTNAASLINHRFGQIECSVNENGSVVVRLIANKNIVNNEYATLALSYPATGTPYATAPTPADDVTANEIVTAEWVKANNDYADLPLFFVFDSTGATKPVIHTVIPKGRTKATLQVLEASASAKALTISVQAEYGSGAAIALPLNTEVGISSLAGKAVKFTIAGNTSQTSAAGLVHLV